MSCITRLAPIVLIGLTISACAPTGDGTEASNTERPKAVQTIVAERKPAVQIRLFPAVLEPPQLVPLSFEVSGRVAEVDLRVGQTVRRGELLATIEPADLDLRLGQSQAALLEARAAAENARADADRQQQLFDRDVVTAAARDQAVALAEQAEARLAQAQSNVDLLRESRLDAELRAPFDAVINSVDIQDFVSVQAGNPVVTLYEEGDLQASILVSFDVVNNLVIGQDVLVTPTDRAIGTLNARISEIGRRAPAVSSFPVIVQLEEGAPQLRSGMAVEVQIQTDAGSTADLIPVPLSAIATNRSGPFEGTPPFPAEVFVFVPDDGNEGELEARNVSIAASAEDQIFVSDGLEPGERVITRGVPFLRDGQRVVLFAPDSKGAKQ